jgi:hypothetical protein
VVPEAELERAALRVAISACISATDGAIDGASSSWVSMVMDSSSTSWEEAMLLDSSDQLSRGKGSDILIGLSVTAIVV